MASMRSGFGRSASIVFLSGVAFIGGCISEREYRHACSQEESYNAGRDRRPAFEIEVRYNPVDEARKRECVLP